MPTEPSDLRLLIADLRLNLRPADYVHSKIQNRKSAIPIIPDGLEPSFSGCKPGVVAAGPRDQFESGLTGTRTRPVQKMKRGWHATPASSCWTMSPSCKAEAVGLEPTTVFTAPVFKTGPSSSRVTSTSCGGRNRTHVTTVQSRLSVPAQTPPHHLSVKLREQESNLRTRRSKQRISTNRNYPAT